MNDLFEALFKAIDNFVAIAEEAPKHISDYGITHHEPTENDLHAWRRLIADVKETKAELKLRRAQGIEAQREEINIILGKLRELVRRMDYTDCYWSSDHKKLDSALRRLVLSRREIDRHYHLGQHYN